MLHGLLYWLGLTSPASAPYLFWSGFAGGVSLFGGALMFCLRHTCHVPMCFRIGKFGLPDSPYHLCAKHHPDVPNNRGYVPTSPE